MFFTNTFSLVMSTNLAVYHLNFENWRPKLMGFVFSLSCEFGHSGNPRLLVGFWRTEELRIVPVLGSWLGSLKRGEWKYVHSSQFHNLTFPNSSLPHLISSLHTGAACITSFLERRRISVSLHTTFTLVRRTLKTRLLTAAKNSQPFPLQHVGFIFQKQKDFELDFLRQEHFEKHI